jgi:hypothetical protein
MSDFRYDDALIAKIAKGEVEIVPRSEISGVKTVFMLI